MQELFNKLSTYPLLIHKFLQTSFLFYHSILTQVKFIHCSFWYCKPMRYF